MAARFGLPPSCRAAGLEWRSGQPRARYVFTWGGGGISLHRAQPCHGLTNEEPGIGRRPLAPLGIPSGPDYWNINKHWRLCALGRKQSPVNIRTDRLLYDHLLGPLQLDWHEQRKQLDSAPSRPDERADGSPGRQPDPDMDRQVSGSMAAHVVARTRRAAAAFWRAICIFIWAPAAARTLLVSSGQLEDRRLLFRSPTRRDCRCPILMNCIWPGPARVPKLIGNVVLADHPAEAD